MAVRVQQEDFDIAAEIAALTRGRGDIGAVVTFSGLCRGQDEGRNVATLRLETYQEMAEEELSRLENEACRRWPLQASAIIHRHGAMKPGDNIVLVICASAHRQAAFEAAAFLMDYLKTRAPFWKAEEAADGSKRWIEAKASDDEAAERW